MSFLGRIMYLLRCGLQPYSVMVNLIITDVMLAGPLTADTVTLTNFSWKTLKTFTSITSLTAKDLSHQTEYVVRISYDLLSHAFFFFQAQINRPSKYAPIWSASTIIIPHMEEETINLYV